MDAEARQLDDLRHVAYRLGMAFGQAAEIEGDFVRKLQLFDAFHRSFASVRLSIALEMRWSREGRLPARLAAEPSEREVERAEALERPDHPGRPEGYAERYTERDRDREAERASLPLLLRTLDSVADDAQALLPAAAELPTLRELLDQVRGQSTPKTSVATPAPISRPSAVRSATPLRARLSGGAATLTFAPPPIPGLPGLPTRRATGPPRR